MPTGKGHHASSRDVQHVDAFRHLMVVEDLAVRCIYLFVFENHVFLFFLPFCNGTDTLSFRPPSGSYFYRRHVWVCFFLLV